LCSGCMKARAASVGDIDWSVGRSTLCGRHMSSRCNMAMLSMQGVGQRPSQLTDKIARTLCTRAALAERCVAGGGAAHKFRTAQDLPQELSGFTSCQAIPVSPLQEGQRAEPLKGWLMSHFYTEAFSLQKSTSRCSCELRSQGLEHVLHIKQAKRCTCSCFSSCLK